MFLPEEGVYLPSFQSSRRKKGRLDSHIFYISYAAISRIRDDLPVRRIEF